MAWVIGRPALNMTESWRLKTAMVLSETLLLPPMKGILNFSFLAFDAQYLDLFLFQGGDDFIRNCGRCARPRRCCRSCFSLGI